MFWKPIILGSQQPSFVEPKLKVSETYQIGALEYLENDLQNLAHGCPGSRAEKKLHRIDLRLSCRRSHTSFSDAPGTADKPGLNNI